MLFRSRPLALVVMGGMVSSTLLTLVVVPAVYSLVEEWLASFRAMTPAEKRRVLLRIFIRLVAALGILLTLRMTVSMLLEWLK